MEEKTDLGREIIKDALLDVDNVTKTKLLDWLKNERKKDAYDLGFEYNDNKEPNFIQQTKMMKPFGNGYICALRHMQEIIDKK